MNQMNNFEQKTLVCFVVRPSWRKTGGIGDQELWVSIDFDKKTKKMAARGFFVPFASLLSPFLSFFDPFDGFLCCFEGEREHTTR